MWRLGFCDLKAYRVCTLMLYLSHTYATPSLRSDQGLKKSPVNLSDTTKDCSQSRLSKCWGQSNSYSTWVQEERPQVETPTPRRRPKAIKEAQGEKVNSRPHQEGGAGAMNGRVQQVPLSERQLKSAEGWKVKSLHFLWMKWNSLHSPSDPLHPGLLSHLLTRKMISFPFCWTDKPFSPTECSATQHNQWCLSVSCFCFIFYFLRTFRNDEPF